MIEKRRRGVGKRGRRRKADEWDEGKEDKEDRGDGESCEILAANCSEISLFCFFWGVEGGGADDERAELKKILFVSHIFLPLFSFHFRKIKNRHIKLA